MKAYYDRRADEYDRTSHDLVDPAALAPVRTLLAGLPSRRTLDIACGTGWLARFLRGPLVGVDQSRRMLDRYRVRHPHAALVRADVPPLPFARGAFERCFAGHFYSHLQTSQRLLLISERNGSRQSW